MGRFVCDFVIAKYHLVIECDGTYWHSSPEQKAKDGRKDHWLTTHGYKVLRLTEEKIRNDLSWCRESILMACQGLDVSSIYMKDARAGDEFLVQSRLPLEL